MDQKDENKKAQQDKEQAKEEKKAQQLAMQGISQEESNKIGMFYPCYIRIKIAQTKERARKTG